MTPDPLFLLSFLISPLIALATTTLLVESFLSLFKIRRGRASSLLRLLPAFSLLLDPFLHDLSVGYWLNPLNCGSCARKISGALFFPLLEKFLDPIQMSALARLGLEATRAALLSVFIVFCVLLPYRALRSLFTELRESRQIARDARLSARPVENLTLATALLKNKVQVFSSAYITIPMVTRAKAIFIPKNIIETYPQNEFEAILAHELEHIRWKDPLIRFCAQALSILFWWVPMRAWRKRVEFDQEIACDRSILKYGIKEESLATAILKLTTTFKKKARLACYLTEEEHPITRRLRVMLHPYTVNRDRGVKTSLGIVAIGIAFFITCVILV